MFLAYFRGNNQDIITSTTSKSMTFSVIFTILKVSGVCPVGFPTVVALWFNVTSMALIALLGDLHPVIAAERNVVRFFDIVQLLE